MKYNSDFKSITELLALVNPANRFEALAIIEMLIQRQRINEIRLLDALKEYVKITMASTDKLEFNHEVDIIVDTIAQILDVKKVDIYSNSRKRELVLARQYIYWVIAKRFPRVTVTHIARVFNKDHATVLHSNKAFNDAIEVDHNYYAELDIIVRVLKANGIDITAAFVLLSNQRKKLLDEKKVKREAASLQF